MTPKRGQIENSFKLDKHGVQVNAHTQFSHDPSRNLGEKLHQLCYELTNSEKWLVELLQLKIGEDQTPSLTS